MSSPQIAFERAQELIALPKRMVGSVVWAATPEGSEIFRASFRLRDAEDATIPGLDVELQYVRGFVKGESHLKLTLFANEPPHLRKLRAYQLCVVGEHRFKHTEKGDQWYGPHKHVGDKPMKVDPAWHCDDHASWFKFFIAEANISFEGDYNPPPSRPMTQLDLGLTT